MAAATLADNAEIFHALIGGFKQQASDRGVPLVAVLAYASDGGDDDADAVDMTGSLAHAGVPSLDTRVLFTSRPEDVARMHSTDGIHWSAEGHAIVAHAIRELLTQMGVK